MDWHMVGWSVTWVMASQTDKWMDGQTKTQKRLSHKNIKFYDMKANGIGALLQSLLMPQLLWNLSCKYYVRNIKNMYLNLLCTMWGMPGSKSSGMPWMNKYMPLNTAWCDYLSLPYLPDLVSGVRIDIINRNRMELLSPTTLISNLQYAFPKN